MHFHPPGITTCRAFSGYTPEEDDVYRILEDVAYSTAYGFHQTRLPTPGQVLPQELIDTRNREVAEGWQYESSRQKGSRGLNPVEDLSPLHQQHLAERMKNHPQTDHPILDGRRNPFGDVRIRAEVVIAAQFNTVSSQLSSLIVKQRLIQRWQEQKEQGEPQ